MSPTEMSRKTFNLLSISSLEITMCFILAGTLPIFPCSGETSPPRCDVFSDVQFGGIFLDCSRRLFTLKDLSLLEFKNATTLVLSYNDIKSLPSNTFIKFPNLKCLKCTHCSLHSLSIDALKGLNNLEVLILNRNSLVYKDNSFPKGCFRHVPKLKLLNIMKNYNSDYYVTDYSQYLDIFNTLPELEHLSIDAFENLRIGKEFTKFQRLQNLRINCDSITSISNDSLKGFQHSNLTRFQLICGRQYIPSHQIGFDVFKFLPKRILHLSIYFLRIGNRNVLHLFKHLKGRNIETITLNSTFSPPYAPFEQKRKDGFLSKEAFRYVSGICVKHFYWYNSRVSAVETGTATSETWQNCLEVAYLETDAVIVNVDYIIFFKLMHLKKLRRAIHMIRGNKLIKEFWSPEIDTSSSIVKYPMEDNFELAYVRKLGASGLSKTFLKKSNVLYPIEKIGESPLHSLVKNNYNGISTKHEAFLSGINAKRPLTKTEMTSNTNTNANVTITLPPALREIIFDGNDFVDLIFNFIFRPNNMTAISITNCGGWLRFDGNLIGLDKLESIDVQGSALFVDPELFKQFPALKKLILRRTRPKPITAKRSVFESFQNIPLLEYLDIAENDVEYLQHDIFLKNSNLKYLCLASNRLSHLSVDLALTPKLEILDLRYNLLSYLSKQERHAIDRHILIVDNFTILFNHNKLSCSCSSRTFIAWLHQNARHFDHSGNYSCLSEDGSLSWTGSYTDRIAFSRQCEGYNIFLGSLIMACALLAVYLAIFLGMKHKTQIISKVVQVLTPGFRMKTPKDFPYHVFIGYAHQEGTFVRHVLLRYLEDHWGLKTFVHQRDLMQDPLLLSTALRDSWRTVLLITENFLDHYDMAYNVMKVACFFVSPSNPRSVVVLVEETVQHRIPDYVLQVVDDDNIIVLPELRGFLDYQDKEILKTSLLYM